MLAEAKGEQGAASVSSNHIRLLEKRNLTREREIFRVQYCETKVGKHLFHCIGIVAQSRLPVTSAEEALW